MGVAMLVLFGIRAYAGALPLTPKQISDVAGYVLLGLSVGLFAWVFLSDGWTVLSGITDSSSACCSSGTLC